MTEQINHVSDTALWVAHYRAIEAKEHRPLFLDPLAEILVGNRGAEIAKSVAYTSKYTRWSVIIRTVVIDQYIEKLAQEGPEQIDAVINLGAGMDTRPYRLKLPESLRWIEVDFPQIIQHKESLLAGVKPNVKLERFALDLSDRDSRKKLFARLGSEVKKALILTEGVVIYLSEDQVATLAEDLRIETSFKFWVAEYFSPLIYSYMNNSLHKKRLQNSPFQFFPPNWFEFFKRSGWTTKEVRYLPIEAEKLGRPMPLPLWIKPFARKRLGYVLFEPTLLALKPS